MFSMTTTKLNCTKKKNTRSITENSMRKLLKNHGMSEKEINIQIQLQKYMNSDPLVIGNNVYVLKEEGEKNEQ